MTASIKSWRFVAVPALAVAAIALATRAADDGKAAPAAAASAAPKPALSVNVTTPQQGEWPQTLAANGNIAAWQEAVVGAEVGGLKLTEVLVNVGDKVKRGQPLARLQSETVAAEVAQTRASLAEAEALRAEAQANAERARQLKASGAISAQQIQQYVTVEQTAAARMQALRAKLHADELKLAQTRVPAPDDGVISARIATVGAVVQPGQELFRLIRQQRLEWRAEVGADQLARVAPGMKATLTPAGGAPVTGTVRMLAPTVDATTRNAIVYVDLPVGSTARAGMFARGEFELGAAKAMTLPQSAVVLRDGYAYVFKVAPDGRVAQTKVHVGRRVGDRIEVVSGLSPDAKVVAAGAGFLADGDVVRVVESPLKAAQAK
jgi:RND family efflux transporter MFP subunit